MNRKFSLLIIVTVVLSTLACGRFTVKNNGPYPVTVKVTLPGSAYGFKTVWNSGSASWSALDYGDYRVDIINDEDYIERLQNLQTKIMDNIFTDAAFEVTDPTRLEEMVEIPGTAVIKDGYLVPSDAPGFGLEVTREWLEGITV